MVSDAYGYSTRRSWSRPTSLVTQAQDFIRMGRAEDLMLQESALIISGDLAARSFPAADREQFTQLVGARGLCTARPCLTFSRGTAAYYTRDINPQAPAR